MPAPPSSAAQQKIQAAVKASAAARTSSPVSRVTDSGRHPGYSTTKPSVVTAVRSTLGGSAATQQARLNMMKNPTNPNLPGMHGPGGFAGTQQGASLREQGAAVSMLGNDFSNRYGLSPEAARDFVTKAARTIAGEAVGETELGRSMVAKTMTNRMDVGKTLPKAGPQYSTNPDNVLSAYDANGMRPGTQVNQAYADAVMGSPSFIGGLSALNKAVTPGAIPESLSKFTHYREKSINRPSWESGTTFQTGGHVFSNADVGMDRIAELQRQVDSGLPSDDMSGFQPASFRKPQPLKTKDQERVPGATSEVSYTPFEQVTPPPTDPTPRFNVFSPRNTRPVIGQVDPRSLPLSVQPEYRSAMAFQGQGAVPNQIGGVPASTFTQSSPEYRSAMAFRNPLAGTGVQGDPKSVPQPQIGGVDPGQARFDFGGRENPFQPDYNRTTAAFTAGGRENPFSPPVPPTISKVRRDLEAMAGVPGIAGTGMGTYTDPLARNIRMGTFQEPDPYLPENSMRPPRPTTISPMAGQGSAWPIQGQESGWGDYTTSDQTAMTLDNWGKIAQRNLDEKPFVDAGNDGVWGYIEKGKKAAKDAGQALVEGVSQIPGDTPEEKAKVLEAYNKYGMLGALFASLGTGKRGDWPNYDDPSKPNFQRDNNGEKPKKKKKLPEEETATNSSDELLRRYFNGRKSV